MIDKLAIRATISSQKMGDWFVNNGTREGIDCWNNVVARTSECLKENQAALDIARAEADTLRAEVKRLRAALRTMVYEATHLSPEEEDLSHWCKFTGDALQAARAALAHGEADQ